MNSLRQFDHDEGARLAGDAIKEKIKSDPTWDNQFLDRNPIKSRCKRTKPAPDGRLHSIKTNCHVAIEYKPPYSHLDEIGKGFTQCFDYIVDQNDKGEFLNQASILVIPEVNENGDKVEEIYKKKFLNTVLDKNPIALVTYSPTDPSKVKLVTNFGQNLEVEGKPAVYRKGDMITFWAAWRENYPTYNYHLLKTAHLYKEKYSNSKERRDNIWHRFYFDYYCYPPQTNNTLNLIPNKLKVWGETESIWQEDVKKDLSKAVKNGSVSYEEAINRLKWASAATHQEKIRYGNTIKNIAVRRPADISTDNDYEDVKKNRRNLISHVGLWDNLTWEVTKLGEKFIERIDQGADPMKEMIMLMLVPGKWYELILDIKKGQAIINHSGSVEYKDKLKEVFISNGSIGLNPERKSSGGRKFLQSEQQILGRFRLLKKHGRTYYKSSLGWEFDEGLIDQYITDYYRYYIEQDVAA